jgi:hypothetical protein
MRAQSPTPKPAPPMLSACHADHEASPLVESRAQAVLTGGSNRADGRRPDRRPATSERGGRGAPAGGADHVASAAPPGAEGPDGVLVDVAERGRVADGPPVPGTSLLPAVGVVGLAADRHAAEPCGPGPGRWRSGANSWQVPLGPSGAEQVPVWGAVMGFAALGARLWSWSRMREY